MANQDSIEWLDTMIEFSHLTDSKPMLAQIRAELRSLREQARRHESERPRSPAVRPQSLARERYEAAWHVKESLR